MNTKNKTRALFVAAGVLALGGVGATQVREVLKILGIGAVVQKFGPEINRGMNRLANHQDTANAATKVVPILSVGSRRAIGAAQVMGSRARVERVKAVAQLDQNLFGNEVKLRAMVPVESDNLSNIQRVDGVGVSGIVDLRVKL